LAVGFCVEVFEHAMVSLWFDLFFEVAPYSGGQIHGLRKIRRYTSPATRPVGGRISGENRR
jgi:hypothetical protein